jgi:hypothetical protein
MPHTSRRPGSHRRSWRISCRPHSTRGLGRRRVRWSAGQPSAVRKGHVAPRQLQGPGTTRLLATHDRANQRSMGYGVERPTSRSHPWAALVRPPRRSTGSSAPRPIVAPGDTREVMRPPKRLWRPWRANQVARFTTRWSWVMRRSVANALARRLAVPGRAPGASLAPSRNSGAGSQTRGDKSGAQGATTRRLASGRGGRSRPPSIAWPLAAISSRQGHLSPLPTQNGQSPVIVTTHQTIDLVVQTQVSMLKRKMPSPSRS